MRSVVLVVGPLPPPIHGAARVTERITQRLRADGASVVQIDTGGASDASRVRYHAGRVRVHLRAARKAWALRGTPSVLYVAGAGGLGLLYQALVVLVGRRAGLRVFFHHHSFAPINRTTPAMLALTRAGGRTLEHVVLCEQMAQGLQARYPAVSRVRVCSNAGLLDPASDRPHGVRTEPHPLVLGHLGNLCVEKGLDIVLATLRRARAAGIHVQLLLAGPATAPDAVRLLAAAADEFGTAFDHVGPIPADEVDEFYRRLDIFVFPSRYEHEAEPLVVLEAARCGVPSFAFGVGCVPSLIADSEWVLPPEADFAAGALRVLHAVSDPAGLAAARVATVEHFTVRRDAASMAQQELVDALLGRR